MKSWVAALAVVAGALPLLATCSDDDVRRRSSGNDSGGDGGTHVGGSATGGTSPTGGMGGVASGGGTGGGSTTTSMGGAGGSPPVGGTGPTGGSNPGVDPPLGSSSGGSGGPIPANGTVQQASGITYRLIVPASPATPSPLLIVYSGTEGGANMTNNLISVAGYTGTGGFIRAVLDGVVYNGNGAAGATVLDALRSMYDIDNDRTYLLSESAGTTAGLELGFTLRQSYFAAYWVNDLNAAGTPSASAAQLGFEPWGQVGPGGQFSLANQVVAAMDGAGYRLPNPAPYAGAGAGQHGSPDQFIAALSWFPGKQRQ